MFGFFIIRKSFDNSCISDHVQPISKPLSVVLADCGHFVVTWSVVCPGLFMWSLGLSEHEVLKTCVNAMKRTHFSMLFLMKLLFPKFLDNTGE